MGNIIEIFIQMRETHIVERFPYLLMWYKSRFVCIAMSMHMHIN
jgi:hypothetical protein